ncbi:CoA transferase [Candidatus Sumerlaeota bacterium]|nr:CoA transferase [Candidatus Sumerlaeota bacterium]
MNSSPGGGILSGIRVVEAATYIFGPGAATVMSDFGAEVIKLENPPAGDPYRYLHLVPPLPPSPLDYCFILEGRNKRSLAVNLQCAEGNEILRKLVARADVFLTNFRPSVIKKLGIGYEELQKQNERLIYAHATGYGELGEEVEKPGYDMTAYWARSGLMDNVRNGDAEPCLSLAGMGDHPSAMALSGAIMIALYQRARTARGTKVSTSLMANGAWANGCFIQAALCGAPAYVRRTRATAENAMVNHYAARDGKRFMLCLIQPDKDWPNLCAAVEKNDLIHDARFNTPEARRSNSAELIAILDAAFLSREMAEWKIRFAQHQIPWSAIATIDEIVADKQMEANGVFARFDHPQFGALRTVSSPISVEGMPKRPPMAAPLMGEHSSEVLESVGYTEKEIEEMVARGTIVTARRTAAAPKRNPV